MRLVGNNATIGSSSLDMYSILKGTTAGSTQDEQMVELLREEQAELTGKLEDLHKEVRVFLYCPTLVVT